MNPREVLKAAARGVATVLVIPWLLSYWLRSAFLGRNLALEGSTQTLALLPGLIGQYLRRAFLVHALAFCDRSATIEFGTVFSQAGARIGANAYIGPRCHIGLAHIDRDVLIAAGVHVPSGARTHDSEDPDVPIRDQAHHRTVVQIGAGSWIGSAAVVMADVGRHSIVGAGAVVTKPIGDYVIAGGVPARVLKSRAPGSTE